MSGISEIQNWMPLVNFYKRMCFHAENSLNDSVIVDIPQFLVFSSFFHQRKEGVKRVLQILEDEFKTVLTMCGNV